MTERASPALASWLPAFLISVVSLVGLAMMHLFLPVLAPILMREAGQPPEAYGFVGGALYFGAVWLFVANSAFTPTLGPIRSLQIGALIASTGALLVMSGSYPLIMLGALLMGFGYATTTPAGSQILADHTPKEYRSSLFSIRQAGVPLGGVLAGTIGGTMIATYGWRAALATIVAICLTVAAGLLLAPSVLAESRPREPFRIARVFALGNIRQPFRIVGEVPGLTRMALACAGFAIVQAATVAFFVIYLTAGLGLELKLAGAMFATMQGASVAGRVILGFVSDRIGSPRPILRLLSLGSSASALLIAAMGPDWSVAALFAGSLLVGLTVSTWNGLYLAEVANLAPAERVSEATAGTTFFVFVTYMVTPPLAALLVRTLGYRGMFMVVAAAGCLSGLVLMRRP